MLSSNGKTLSYRVNDLIEGTEYHLIKVEAAAITIATAGGQSTQIAFGQPLPLTKVMLSVPVPPQTPHPALLTQRA